ncbi:Gag-Pol polyprotein [Erysiphe neolycopersici]|uniref:Gag-Pol polyprotein n=1 Tax=Erysiphe neolycopersici TaxID=212602 RepID=A0A420HYT3_9PEZI|nr:Gag-Pol polyprotein [Erysiphe neolycopersici]
MYWVRAIKPIADQFDLHQYYHPDSPAGPERVNEFTVKAVDEAGQTKLKLWKAWVAQEAKLIQAIEFNLHPDPMAVIATERTSKDRWAKLKSQYEGPGAVLEYSAIQDCVRQSILDFPNLETYINHFQKTCERLVTLDLIDVTKWHPTMFVMGVEDHLSSLIADLTDEARESQIKTSLDVAMIGASNLKGKGKISGRFPQNGGSKGNLHHCKCCGNLQARHITEKCFEDPRNRDARISREKKNKKKWVDFNKRNTLENNRKENTENQRGGDSDDDQSSSFAEIASTLAFSSLNNSYVLSVSAFVSSIDSLRWIVDTGADRHICKDLELFDTLLQHSSLPMIGTANGPTRSLGIGTVCQNSD